jgi:hypothetical protein
MEPGLVEAGEFTYYGLQGEVARLRIGPFAGESYPIGAWHRVAKICTEGRIGPRELESLLEGGLSP